MPRLARCLARTSEILDISHNGKECREDRGHRWSGLVGRNIVNRLVAQGHDPVPAWPATGVNTITGEGLADVVAGADVVVKVSNAPVWDDDAVMRFCYARIACSAR